MFQKKVCVFNESAAKNKKNKHTLIPNPNSKKMKSNASAENDDIADIPNSEETINQLHFQHCKTNNLSELDFNQLNQNMNSLNITHPNANNANPITNSIPMISTITNINRNSNNTNTNTNNANSNSNVNINTTENYNAPIIQDDPHQMMKNPYPIRQWQTNNFNTNDLLIHNEPEYNQNYEQQINFTNTNKPYLNHNYNYIPKNPNYPNFNPYYNYYMNSNVQHQHQQQHQPQCQQQQESVPKLIYPKQNHMNINEIYTQKIPNSNCISQPMKQINTLFTENAFTYNIEQYELKKKKKLKERLDQTLFTINIDQLLQGADIRTTIMIRHIPNKYSSQTLLEEIEDACKNKYDFFYLPIDAENQCNLGYSFINFLNPFHIIYFFKMFKSRKWNHYKSHKECDLTFAKFQGKVELTAHLEKNSHKIDENKKPMLFTPPNPLPKIDLPIEYQEFIKESRPELIPEINFK